MRVAFVTHNFPRTADDVAGHFLLPLAQALGKEGIEVRVVAPADRGQAGEGTIGGVAVRRVRYASPESERLAYTGELAARARTPGGMRALVGLVRALGAAAAEELRAGADLLHAHWWVPAGLALPRRAPAVVTVHGTDAALLGRSRLARLVARPVFRHARAATAVSRHLAAIVTDATGRSIGPDRILPMPAVLPAAPPDGPRRGLVLVSRLTPQKRVHLAVEALAALNAGGDATALTIVGDGPERTALERQAAALGLSGLVRFVGAVPPAEVHAHMGRAEAALFPARGEGFGLVVVEALAAGTPVVCCRDGGGVLDIMATPGAGAVTEPTPVHLADGVRAVLADPRRHAQAARAGATWRDALAPAQVATRFAALYRSVTRA